MNESCPVHGITIDFHEIFLFLPNKLAKQVNQSDNGKNLDTMMSAEMSSTNELKAKDNATLNCSQNVKTE